VKRAGDIPRAAARSPPGRVVRDLRRRIFDPSEFADEDALASKLD
jgi:hypothetical protein